MPKPNEVGPRPAQKHVDGLTGQVFNTEQEYLNHVSPITGYTPKDPEHHGTRFVRQQKKALERGGSLTPEREQELDATVDRMKANDVDHKRDAEINRKKREAKGK